MDGGRARLRGPGLPQPLPRRPARGDPRPSSAHRPPRVSGRSHPPADPGHRHSPPEISRPRRHHQVPRHPHHDGHPHGLGPRLHPRSRLEELLLQICADHDLPLPAANVPLLGYEVDFLWPAARFVVEADGGDHLNPAQRDKDNLRDLVLGRAGYLVRRYSWHALNNRSAVAEEVLSTLSERLRT